MCNILIEIVENFRCEISTICVAFALFEIIDVNKVNGIGHLFHALFPFGELQFAIQFSPYNLYYFNINS